MMRATTLLVGFSAWAWTLAASAQPRVVVPSIDGANGRHARAAIVSELDQHSLELVPSAAAERAATQAQADLATEAGRIQVARALHISAWVIGELEGKGRKVGLVIRVYNGRDGAVLGETTIHAPGHLLARQVKQHFWSELGSAFDKAQPPEEIAATPAPVEEPAPATPPVSAPAQAPPPPAQPDHRTEPSRSRRSPLDVSLGLRLATRNFSYNDPLPGLRRYAMSLSPELALHLHFYPAARATRGVLGNLGLDLRGETLVGVTSKNPAGISFTTRSLSWGAGLRWRFPVQRHELGLLLGYGQHSFSFSSSAHVDPGVPDVSYGFLRTGADLRLWLAKPLALELSAAYLLAVSHGAIASTAWFPHTIGGGLEAEAGLGLNVTSQLELQVAAALERHFLTFNPELTDPGVLAQHRVAGGALDQYLSMRLAALWRL